MGTDDMDAHAMNDDDRTMLALAALTYRGFGLHSEAAIAKALEDWWQELPKAGCGTWELVWGPATFRSPTSLFDDAMVYVAQQTDGSASGARYAVAIRGTNPVSVFDWMFGDLWVRLQIEQPDMADTGARLSASTALGMAIIQRLAAAERAADSRPLAGLGNRLASAVAGVAGLPEINPRDWFDNPDTFTDGALLARLGAIGGKAGVVLRNGALGGLLTQFDHADVLAALERRAYDSIIKQVEHTQDEGPTLLKFLDETLKRGDRLAVTGHSKGGALAIAAAHWLARHWSDRGIEVECFSFAGPTAGNAAFARCYDATLKSRTRRIVNRRDIVPHAWAPDELLRLADVYPVLGHALGLLQRSVAELGYAHVGGELIEIPLQDGPGGLMREIVYQHLDAYLAAAGLPHETWTAASLFLSS